MEIYNKKTKQWKEEKSINIDEIKKIVGDKTPMEWDSLGNIKINKILSADEKKQIEEL